MSKETRSIWLDLFNVSDSVSAADLAGFREQASHTHYAEIVLKLARQGKLAPALLTEAAYEVWLGAENPKKVMSGSDWAELFRLAYDPSHEFFETHGS